MSNQTTTEALETQDVAYWADMLDSLENLQKNLDFQKVINKGYLQDKALNGVSLLARDDVKKRGERPDVMEELIAISALQDYLFTIYQLGAGARQDIGIVESPDYDEDADFVAEA